MKIDSMNFRAVTLAIALGTLLTLGASKVVYAQDAYVQQLLQQGDFEAVARIWEDGVANGDPAHMRDLAKLHYSGAIRNADPLYAIELLKTALEYGNLAASLDLGLIYKNGIGLPADKVKAETYFEVAYEAGNNEAAYLYAQLIMSRAASDDEIGRALEALRRSSMVGYGPSLSAVADLMRTGTYVPQNLQMALDYYEKAGQNQYYEGYNSIADMYAFAELGHADLEAAREWYAKAATYGVVAANYSLALILYADPNASDADLSLAFEYAKVAAHAWNEGAQTLLGRMYLEDRAVPLDPYEAYIWLDLAASASVHEALHLRAIASRLIGVNQSEEAHAAASEWFTQNHSTPHIHRLLTDNFHSFK